MLRTRALTESPRPETLSPRPHYQAKRLIRNGSAGKLALTSFLQERSGFRLGGPQGMWVSGLSKGFLGLYVFEVSDSFMVLRV